MDEQQRSELETLLLDLVPADGAQIGNKALREAFSAAAADLGHADIGDDQIEDLKQSLIQKGVLVKGKGRGGAVKRTHADSGAFTLQTSEKQETETTPPAKKSARKAAAPRKKSGEATEVISYRHADKRRNNPEVGMVKPENDPDDHQDRWCYDPHIDPALQFDFGRAQMEKLIDDALASGDPDTLRATLEELKRYSAPYLNWTGKAERTAFEVDTVSLHVHERIDPASILSAVRKKLKEKRGAYLQPDLFAAPFENLPLHDAIDFYKHERGWANRLVAGDSLLVMNSLLQKEGMAGQVQMIYIDPPYGIKYGSNFQPFVNKRDVKDRNDADLTQEPEMIKAFRDTWELGIHSYLTYLRDRLFLAKELLSESGSVFVQISDENVHFVRNLLDDVFGVENCVALITFKKTTGAGSFAGGTNLIPTVADYLLWYGKDKAATKYRQIYSEKSPEIGGGEYTSIELTSGERRSSRGLDLEAEKGRLFRVDNVTSQTTRIGQTTVFPVEIEGRMVLPQAGGWKTNRFGMSRLVRAGRIVGRRGSLGYIRFMEDFPAIPINAFWEDTVIAGRPGDKLYAVQTAPKVIERCLLMTTDPGDLVLDPTCGSMPLS